MNTRGSEWRKWDLHVHTPASLCSEYGGDNDEIWEQFIQRIENLPSDIKVLGINDYLFLDGYEKVLKYKKSQISGFVKPTRYTIPFFTRTS